MNTSLSINQPSRYHHPYQTRPQATADAAPTSGSSVNPMMIIVNDEEGGTEESQLRGQTNNIISPLSRSGFHSYFA